jgi:hypothetical protein
MIGIRIKNLYLKLGISLFGMDKTGFSLFGVVKTNFLKKIR